MEPKPSISECGLFVAVPSRHNLHIHSLSSSSKSESPSPKHYDLSKIFHEYKELHGRSSSDSVIKISIVQWEHVDAVPSTKVAVYASDDTSSLILIFILADESPIIIEADPIGIDRLQWLPIYQSGQSAYSNSTILAVFTRFALDLKVYSLTHTHVLYTIPKPLVKEIFVRPGDSGLWSVVASPFYDKNMSQNKLRSDPAASWPALLQFHTDDNSCSLVASLKLDFDPSMGSLFTWSLSGKWLSYFDTFHMLSAPKLSVFNALGIHNTETKDVACHVLQTTCSHNYVTDTSEAEIAGLSPKSLWGKLSSIEYVVVIPERTSESLYLRISDISSMSRPQLHNLDLRLGPTWKQSHDRKNKPQYKRVEAVPRFSKHTWSKTVTFGSSHLIAGDGCLIIFRSSFDFMIQLHIVAIVLTSSKLLDAMKLSNGNHILVFADHIALQSSAGLEVISSSLVHYIDVKMIEKDEGVRISIVERSDSGSVWKQLDYKFSKKSIISSKNSPFVKPIGVEHADGEPSSPYFNASGTMKKSLKRAASETQPSDISGVSEQLVDITDTFQIQKKRRL